MPSYEISLAHAIHVVSDGDVVEAIALAMGHRKVADRHYHDDGASSFEFADGSRLRVAEAQTEVDDTHFRKELRHDS